MNNMLAATVSMEVFLSVGTDSRKRRIDAAAGGRRCACARVQYVDWTSQTKEIRD